MGIFDSLNGWQAVEDSDENGHVLVTSVSPLMAIPYEDIIRQKDKRIAELERKISEQQSIIDDLFERTKDRRPF